MNIYAVTHIKMLPHRKFKAITLSILKSDTELFERIKTILKYLGIVDTTVHRCQVGAVLCKLEFHSSK